MVCNKPSSSSATNDSNAELLIDGVPVTPVQNVRDLGIYTDSDLSMRTHVQRTTSSCFDALRQLRQIRRLVGLPTATFQTLTVAFVNQRLDYGNSTLVGIPAYLMCRLQSALNAAARLIFHLRRSDDITNALVSLHWLRVLERIQFKIAVLTYRVRSCCRWSIHLNQGNVSWFRLESQNKDSVADWFISHKCSSDFPMNPDCHS